MAEKPIVLKYPIEILNPELPDKIPSPQEDEKLLRKQFFFADGKWMPANQPLTMGEKNYTDVRNIRQGEGCIEGVQGYTKMMTSQFSAIANSASVYYKTRAAMQLRTPFSTKSRLMVELWDAASNSAAIFQNIQSIPSIGSFISTPLLSTITGGAIGRFALWPDNQIAYCNGQVNKIYGGDEIRCAAMITTVSAVTATTLASPRNYTQQVTNDLQTSDEVATIGGSNDANVLLLLDCDGGASAVMTDESAQAHGVASIVGGAWTTASYIKFGDGSLRIASASAAIQYDSHANWGSIKTIDFWIREVSNFGQLAATMSFVASEKRISTVNQTYINNAPVLAGDTVCTWDTTAVNDRLLKVESVNGTTLILDGGETVTDQTAICRMEVVRSLAGCYSANTLCWQLVKGYNIFLNIASGAGVSIFNLGYAAPCINDFQHIEFCNATNSVYVLVDGIKRTSIENVTLPTLTNAYIRFGETQRNVASASRNISGNGIYFDEIRTSDIVRHTADFSPPTTAYVSGGGGRTFLVGSTRPLKGGKFYIPCGEGNPTTSTLSMSTWNGVSWQDVTITDNTSSGGKALALTGTWSCTSTVGTSKTKYVEGYVLYWYQFTLSAGAAQIYKVTLDADIQDVNDIWNGEQMLIGGLLKYQNTTYEDYVDYMNDDSKATFMSLASIMASEYALLGFPVPMCGFMLDMVSNNINQTVSSSMIIDYCNGTAVANWLTVTGFYDGTAYNNSITLNKTGVVFFNPLDKGGEFKTAINDENKLHYYKMRFTVPLYSGSAQIWRIKGIPAPQKILPYNFPFMFKNRPMLCGLDIQNEGGRVDYGETDTFAFFNGTDTSLGVDGAPLYFGGNESLTGAVEVYNRIGSTLYHVAVFTKDRETYILNGYDKDTFQILKLSSTLGCPAPQTMDTIEMGYGDKAENMRCIALWLSHNGPVIFDTTNLVPIWDDIACYFDRLDDRCINFNAIDKAVGWVDPEHLEYNLCIPSGTGQTTNNVWLFYDLHAKKWWAKVSPLYPQTIAKVADVHGTQYVYGFFDDGFMRRLDFGKTYDTTDIERYVQTADIVPTGDMWDMTRMRRLKVITGVNSETAMMSITHFASGASTLLGTVLTSVSLNTSAIFMKNTQGMNLLAWSHKLKFALSGNVTNKGLRLIAWGGEFNVEREDV